jgi:predicted acyltransferase
LKKSSDAPSRALALDALRGLAILAMCLSGVVPFRNDTLPAWMYHAQQPPPTHVFNASLPGYTWVDLVFPAFLFSMGAAFPLALAGRLRRGVSLGRIVPGIVGRGIALAAFAVIIQNLAPYHMNSSPDARTWITALLGFALLFAVFGRFPDTWPRDVQWGIRLGGLLMVWGLLESIAYPRGGGWTVRRFDIIIMVLANMAVFGSLYWLATRHSLLMRVAGLGLVFAALEANKVSGSWVNVWMAPVVRLGEWKVEFGWLYNFAWLKYLFIVVPGTIVGDQLLAWMEARRQSADSEPPMNRWRVSALAAGLIAVVVFVHVGLQARWTTLTPLVALAACGALALLVRRPEGDAERFLRGLLVWGTFWLAIGMLFEPTEGGIKKDPSTMSYYFVSAGLSCFLLLSLTVWIDLLGARRAFGLLIANGQNPMLAYAGIRNLLAPVMALTGLEQWAVTKVFSGPWPRAAWAAIKTLLLGVAVAVFTRLRVFWRT